MNGFLISLLNDMYVEAIYLLIDISKEGSHGHQLLKLTELNSLILISKVLMSRTLIY